MEGEKICRSCRVLDNLADVELQIALNLAVSEDTWNEEVVKRLPVLLDLRGLTTEPMLSRGLHEIWTLSGIQSFAHQSGMMLGSGGV